MKQRHLTYLFAVLALVLAVGLLLWQCSLDGFRAGRGDQAHREEVAANPTAGRTDSSELSRSAQSRMDARRQRVSGKVDPRLAALADLVARFAEVEYSYESRKALDGELDAWFNELLEREGRDGASAVLADFLRSGMDDALKRSQSFLTDRRLPIGVLVMSRIGGYFQQIGSAYNKEANQLREKTDDATKAEVLRLDELSYSEFLNAARVFAKLQQRFPDVQLELHSAGMRAVQNYVLAHQYNQALNYFIAENIPETDDTEIRAQTLYKMGQRYEDMPVDGWKVEVENRQFAYSIYRRVSFDFPDSRWAKYARDRLAKPVFEKIIEVENQERGRMIESLKESRNNR